eukprot:2149534-Amphidinium_carterae.1
MSGKWSEQTFKCKLPIEYWCSEQKADGRVRAGNVTLYALEIRHLTQRQNLRYAKIHGYARAFRLGKWKIRCTDVGQMQEVGDKTALGWRCMGHALMGNLTKFGHPPGNLTKFGHPPKHPWLLRTKPDPALQTLLGPRKKLTSAWVGHGQIWTSAYLRRKPTSLASVQPTPRGPDFARLPLLLWLRNYVDRKESDVMTACDIIQIEQGVMSSEATMCYATLILHGLKPMIVSRIKLATDKI